MTTLKRKSADAIAEAKEYLQRDKRAVSLLHDVEVYIGELRRLNAELKERMEALTESNAALTKDRDAISVRLDETISLCRQSDSQLAATKREAERLQGEVDKAKDNYERTFEAQFEDFPQQLNEDAEFVVLRRLSRRFARLYRGPSPKYKLLAIPGDARAMEFNIREWVSDYSDDEFLRIGLLVILMCMIPHNEASVVFSRTDEKPRRKTSGSSSDAWIRWWHRHGWVEITEDEKALHRIVTGNCQ